MDAKYGRLYTEADVERILTAAVGTLGHPMTHGFRAAIDRAKAESAIPADEPTFLLRAKDAAAGQSIINTHFTGIDYYDHAQNVGASPATLEAIKAAANEMKHWQSQNRQRVKVPD